MQNQETISIVLQAVTALSEFAFAIIASIGLRQLTLAKRGLRQTASTACLAATRESLRLAVEQCRIYAADIVPLMNQCDQEFRRLDLLNFLNSFSVKATDEGITVNPPEPFPPQFNGESFYSIDAIKAFLPVHNALEVFALMFTKGVANEQVAFSSVGRSFCNHIHQYAPLIIQGAGSGEYPGSGHHQNLLELFVLWQRRLDKIELQKKHDEVSKQLAKTRDISIRPIGTSQREFC